MNKTVAAIQMTSAPDLDHNLRTAERLLSEAAGGGATLILLPENFAYYFAKHGSSYRQVAEQQGMALQAWLQHWARTLSVTLIGGTIPLATRADGSMVAADRVRAASLIVSPDGDIVGRYDKLHLFDASIEDAQGRYCESNLFEPGERIVVRDVGALRVGLAVCYDVRFALLARALADAGAQLLTYPSAFTEATGTAHWQVLLRARAVESGCYVLAANQCGQHSEKRRSYGHSLLIDPWGRIVSELKNEVGVLLADIDTELLENIRNNLPLYQHQRLKVELPDDLSLDI